MCQARLNRNLMSSPKYSIEFEFVKYMFASESLGLRGKILALP